MIQTLILVLLGAAALGGAGLVLTNNNIKKAENQIDEAYSTMDIYLKQRHDLIPNLVETVKSYAKHESETLENLTKITTNAAQSQTIASTIENENKLDNAIRTLSNLQQRYPELSSNQNYQQLMLQLQKTETDISNARKYYNASVREFNNKLDTFPGSLLAKNKKSRPYFQVSSLEERDNVKVDLN